MDVDLRIRAVFFGTSIRLRKQIHVRIRVIGLRVLHLVSQGVVVSILVASLSLTQTSYLPRLTYFIESAPF